mgnify:CR=1 FL=1
MSQSIFEAFWKIYDESFPDDEKRDIEGQKALLNDKDYKTIFHYDEGRLIGFLCYWNLDRFNFVEHIAIAREFRGRGAGSLLMKNLIRLGKRIVLEVEPPEDDIKRKRIAFYEHLGFSMNEYHHVQPPLKMNANPVELRLMSHPEPLSPEDVQFIEVKLQNTVYSKNTF